MEGLFFESAMRPNQDPRDRPEIIALGGPNGAGKTTTASRILPHGLNEGRFLNADFMAKAISPHDPAGAAIEAGRMMLGRMRRYRKERKSFSFESTLASLGFARFLEEAKAEGYVVRLGYVTLPSPELSIHRVSQRVSRGGHDIPEPVIRRRYWRSLVNFETLYRPLCDAWTVYDNRTEELRPIASQRHQQRPRIHEPELWTEFATLRTRALEGRVPDHGLQ
ncbi:Zeta toxin [Planctomycetes bacterium Poly30]|uniref:Zeta toxin n=1 Tax=Saltatorellus ferox TaxID=2528018 RepID=A0A518F078_9BACT|nr:Zeta toxin [Planctomycetes bacterium Poly30]